MSGPWEDYGGKTAAAPAPVSVSSDAPWMDYAPPITPENTAPAAPSYGFDLTAPAKDRTEFLGNLRRMTAGHASPQELKDYAATNGSMFPQETLDWMHNTYAAHPYETDFAPVEKPDYSIAGSDNLGAAWQGLKSGALMGWDDELNAASRASANILGSYLGTNNTSASWGDVYDHYLNQNRQIKDTAYGDSPWAYAAGWVPGMVLSAAATKGAGGPALAEGAPMSAQAAQAARIGATQGGATGAGNADGGIVDRIVGGLEGGGLGAGLGLAAAPLASAGANVFNRLLQNIGPRGAATAETSGLDALAARAPQTGADMAARAQAMRDAGVEPRLQDVVDASGRAVIRNANSKMTPGRQVAETAADQAYADTQGRVAQQARRIIGGPDRTARQIADDIAEQRKDPDIAATFAKVGDQPVTITPEIAQAFSTQEGRSALRQAGRLLPPAERGQVDSLIGAINLSNKLGSPEDQAIRLMPGYQNLGDQAKASVMKQMMDQGLIKDPLADAHLSVDVADRFREIMQPTVERGGRIGAAAKGYVQAVTGTARQQYPDYDAALQKLSQLHRVEDAALGQGRFSSSDFLGSDPHDYNRAVGQASTVPPEDGGVSEMDALKARAADEVRHAATSGSGAGAPGVARQFATGGEQAQRSASLLGQEGADNLSKTMGYEAQRAANSRFVDPRTGSQTFGRAQDALVDGFAEAAGHVVGNPFWGTVRLAGRWLKNSGIRGVDAERLARDSISDDPQRVDQAIQYLADKGLARHRAERFVSTYGAALGGRGAGAQVSAPSTAQPPNSVRALNTTPTEAPQQQ